MCSISGLVSTTLAWLRIHARSSVGRVAVVGRGDERRAPATRGTCAAGPARAPWWGTRAARCRALPSTTDVDDRELVAERLARRGAGRDHDVASGAQRVDRVGLVRPERVDAAAAQALGRPAGDERRVGVGAGRAARAGSDGVRRRRGRSARARGRRGCRRRRPARPRRTASSTALNGSAAPRRRRSRRAGRRRRRS